MIVRVRVRAILILHSTPSTSHIHPKSETRTPKSAGGSPSPDDATRLSRVSFSEATASGGVGAPSLSAELS